MLERNNIRIKEIERKMVVTTYDLQAVLPAPSGNTSEFYYKSQINSYNLIMNELHSNCVKYFFWHKDQGNRDAIEIGFCVLKYLEEKAITKNNNSFEIIFCSDNCCKWRKNKCIMRLYNSLKSNR